MVRNDHRPFGSTKAFSLDRRGRRVAGDAGTDRPAPHDLHAREVGVRQKVAGDDAATTVSARNSAKTKRRQRREAGPRLQHDHCTSHPAIARQAADDVIGREGCGWPREVLAQEHRIGGRGSVQRSHQHAQQPLVQHDLGCHRKQHQQHVDGFEYAPRSQPPNLLGTGRRGRWQPPVVVVVVVVVIPAGVVVVHRFVVTIVGTWAVTGITCSALWLLLGLCVCLLGSGVALCDALPQPLQQQRKRKLLVADGAFAAPLALLRVEHQRIYR